MGAAEMAVWIAARATHELTLFAALGIVIGGVDDLLVDLIWIARTVWRRVIVYTRHDRADAGSLAGQAKGRITIFVPAWREADVIGPMLETALDRWGEADYRIYVGCYPNDPDSIAAVCAVASRNSRVRLAVNPRRGGTTKGDNLNAMWRALVTDERDEGILFKAVALHDVEDVVHPAEIGIYAALCGRYDLVQLPVLPLIERERGWWARAVSSVSADEFAETHGKQLVVREAIGAAMPSAGVGCGFSRDMLGKVAARYGVPFDGSSLTEDYELGLRIAELGGRGVFVRLPGQRGGKAVSVRAHFPDSLDAAVRQKARWQAGIALSGWKRLGWRGGLAERWMRYRDRRAILSALVLLCAYASGVALLVLLSLGAAPLLTPAEQWLFRFCTAIMLWRIAVRAVFVGSAYGWREALGSIPRLLIGNVIAMASARKALQTYFRLARGASVHWDKTEHVFPRTMPAE